MVLTNSDTAGTVVENTLEGIPVTLMTNVEGVSCLLAADMNMDGWT